MIHKSMLTNVIIYKNLEAKFHNYDQYIKMKGIHMCMKNTTSYVDGASFSYISSIPSLKGLESCNNFITSLTCKQKVIIKQMTRHVGKSTAIFYEILRLCLIRVIMFPKINDIS